MDSSKEVKFECVLCHKLSECVVYPNTTSQTCYECYGVTDYNVIEVLLQDDPLLELYTLQDEEEDIEILCLIHGIDIDEYLASEYEYYNSTFDIYEHFGIDDGGSTASGELEAVMGSS